jgi:hypothetical protein
LRTWLAILKRWLLVSQSELLRHTANEACVNVMLNLYRTQTQF